MTATTRATARATTRATSPGRPGAAPTDHRPLPERARRFVGGFYLSMGGVHLGIVVADTGFYRSFADHA